VVHIIDVVFAAAWQDYTWPLTEWMDDIELADAELLPENSSSFSNALAHHMLLLFRGSGTFSRVNHEEFLQMMLQLLKLRNTEQSRIFCTRLFRYFDQDEGDSVSWQEFLDGVYRWCRGPPSHRSL